MNLSHFLLLRLCSTRILSYGVPRIVFLCLSARHGWHFGAGEPVDYTYSVLEPTDNTSFESQPPFHYAYTGLFVSYLRTNRVCLDATNHVLSPLDLSLSEERGAEASPGGAQIQKA